MSDYTIQKAYDPKLYTKKKGMKGCAVWAVMKGTSREVIYKGKTRNECMSYVKKMIKKGK